ncbi:hypothetical protein CKAH01_04589 [Colletotrichum kahawae]|uniref:Uncharacterized protein n=1 Tax=Colletotrichum kahawae TaxID=34407 RepID=A0AAD9YJ25_COLKA|nr:hypothetical protein CKAH01_04589 [Colletotrichum kahawae]
MFLSLSLSLGPPPLPYTHWTARTNAHHFFLNCKMHPFTESQRASSRLPCAGELRMGFRSLNSHNFY